MRRKALGEDPSKRLEVRASTGGLRGVCRSDATAIVRSRTCYGPKAGGYHKRVERIWREEGLKVLEKQRKQGRLWPNDGSCIRLRPPWPTHVWSYDFVSTRTDEGRPLKLLTVLDEYTRECLAIVAARTMKAYHVLEARADLFVLRGPPEHPRSDNGPEFTAKLARRWVAKLGV